MTETKERLDRGTGTGLGPPWHVIVLNDNHNTFDGVAAALRAVLPDVSFEQGMAFANRIHTTGARGRLVGPPRGGRALLERAQAAGPDDGPARSLAGSSASGANR